MAKNLRFDDYGFVTYLKLKGYHVMPEKKGIEVYFTVTIEMAASEKELETYKNSEFQKFDEASKQLKKARNVLLNGLKG